jgi:hypothetical protein
MLARAAPSAYTHPDEQEKKRERPRPSCRTGEQEKKEKRTSRAQLPNRMSKAYQEARWGVGHKEAVQEGESSRDDHYRYRDLPPVKHERTAGCHEFDGKSLRN